MELPFIYPSFIIFAMTETSPHRLGGHVRQVLEDGLIPVSNMTLKAAGVPLEVDHFGNLRGSTDMFQ